MSTLEMYFSVVSRTFPSFGKGCFPYKRRYHFSARKIRVKGGVSFLHPGIQDSRVQDLQDP